VGLLNQVVLEVGAMTLVKMMPVVEVAALAAAAAVRLPHFPP
tara:strand:+ start:101 stop:226 length:126 start_codon:yes stop_codon:yes gene_type:complete